MAYIENPNLDSIKELLFRDTSPFDLAKELCFIYHRYIQYVLKDSDLCGELTHESNSVYFLRCLILALLETAKDNNEQKTDFITLFEF